MKSKRYDKRYLPMLWIGLAIWVLSMAISMLLELLGCEVPTQENLMGMAKGLFQTSRFATLFLFCVLVPFLEECSFRLWAAGKKWTLTLCLAGMLLFSGGELSLWGLLAVVGMVLVARLTKDEFKINWMRALISSLCFALCHISGFKGFSLGMIFGLADIFGMALVMCWLVINVSFWCSVVLHMLNNLIAFLWPMLFLASPVTMVRDDFTTELSALNFFSSDAQSAVHLYDLDSSTTDFTLIGEPADLAYELFGNVYPACDAYVFWESEGNSLEERVKYHVSLTEGKTLNKALLLEDFIHSVAQFRDHPLTFDTSRVMRKRVYLAYDDGREEPFVYSKVNASLNLDPYQRYESWAYIITEMHWDEENDLEKQGDSTTLYERTYIIPKAHPAPTNNFLTKLYGRLDKTNGCHLELRDDQEVSVITIR